LRAVSPAGIQKIAAVEAAPDDHLTDGQNCRVKGSRSGRIRGAGGCPAISAGIVSPASVKIMIAVDIVE
jgi:hypothetical protein